MKRTYTPKERNLYLVGLAGQNMIYNIINTGLFFYFQSVLCLPAIAISTFMAVARVWDGINDPMMGTIVDKTRTKYGKCRPFLIYAPPIVGIITILAFCNSIYPTAADKTKFFIIAWASISYILWGMSYTVGDIPLWGIISLMTEDENDRSKLIALARIIAAVGGGVILVAITPVSQALGQSFAGSLGVARGQQAGFFIVAVVATIIATVLFEFAGLGTKEHVEQPSRKQDFKENVKMMWKNKPFRALLVSGVIRSPSLLLSNIAMTLLSYYYGNYYGNYVVFMLVLGGGLMVGMMGISAFAPMLTRKIEKKKLYNFASLACSVPLVLVYVAYKIAPYDLDKPGWVALCAVLFFIGGCSLGILNVLQSLMIADAVDLEEYENGVRPDGVFFSGQSFITKLSSGIASIITGIVYTIVGFSSTNTQICNLALYNGASFKLAFSQYAEAMFFLCSIPPAIGMALSVIPMRWHKLSDKKHQEILDALVEKRTSTELQ